MPDNIGMTETTQMAMIGELRKVLQWLHCPKGRSLSAAQQFYSLAF